MDWKLSRRSWLQVAGLGSLLAGASVWGKGLKGQAPELPHNAHQGHQAGHLLGTVGRVAPLVLDPTRFLRSWNFNHLPPDERSKFYRETARPDGTMLREYEI